MKKTTLLAAVLILFAVTATSTFAAPTGRISHAQEVRQRRAAQREAGELQRPQFTPPKMKTTYDPNPPVDVIYLNRYPYPYPYPHPAPLPWSGLTGK